jgi:hypothetical protein
MVVDAMRKLLAILAVGVFALVLGACEEQGTAERAGEAVDKAAEEAGEAVEEAGEAAEEAGEAAEGQTNN